MIVKPLVGVVTAIILLAGASFSADASQRRSRNDERSYRVDEREVTSLIRRIEDGADRFRRSLDHALDRRRIDGSRREDDINQFVKDFEEATNRLRDGVNDHRTDARDAEEVLGRARVIDSFMRRHRLESRAENDWARLRGDLNRLARLYRVSSRWDDRHDRRHHRP